jgi:hypothetical protein
VRCSGRGAQGAVGPDVHHDARVDVDAADFCERAWTGLLHQAEWADEFGGQTPRRRPKQLHVRRGRAVTRREDWLVSREGVDIAHAFEASAMPLEHSDKAGVGPGCDLRDFFRGGLAELAELQLACFVAYVHSVKRQRMKVHIEPEGAVGALHERERPNLHISNGTQPELALRTPTQRALQRIGERAENIGTKSSVIAQRAAKSPRERADPLTDRDSGKTASTRCAATNDMRRPRHEGQKPRRLQEKPTTIS